MNIFIFKQHFYKYISKVDFAIALPAVAGTIATTFMTGYSSYLSDRNARIERLNKKPLNHIYVDYISFEDYKHMTDKRNWKPAKLRQEREKKQEEAEKNSKKEKLIDTINSWLSKNANKQTNKNSNDEVSAESLKQLSIDNKMVTVNVKKQGNNEKQTVDIIINNKNDEKKQKDKYKIIDSISKIEQTKNSEKTQNLPPMRVEIEQPKYFIVQSSVGGRRYDPEEYRAKHAKQYMEYVNSSSKGKIGKIGSKEIAKDDNIFQSIMRIWRKILFIKVDEKNQIINSNYDQYGNRIKKHNTNKIKQQDEKELNNINKDNTYNKNARTNKNYAENNDENSDIPQKFIIPTFYIDGNLQKITEYNKFKEIATKNNLNAADLQTLAYLEYIIENCWYEKYHDKYENNPVNASFVVFYHQNMKPYEIQFERIDPKLSKTKQQSFKDDVIKTISSCDISYINGIKQGNYNLWGKIRVEFIKK